MRAIPVCVRDAPDRRPDAAKGKSRLSAGLSRFRLVGAGIIDPVSGFGPHDAYPAAADRAFGYRPAVGRASDPGSGSAGRDSGSGSTSGISLVEVASTNSGHARLVSEKLGSTLIIAWRLLVAAVARGTSRKFAARSSSKLAMYNDACTGPTQLPPRVPAVRKCDVTFRTNGGAWIISPSKSSTALCLVRSMA